MDFPIYKHEERLTYVAYFYERLARHLLDLPLPSPEEWEKRRRLDHFDLEHGNLRAYIEVKGSSNANALKIFKDQLDGQLTELGFPFDEGMALIFSYTNRGPRERTEENKITRKSLLLGMKSWQALAAFLSEHTTKLYAVDIRLLAELGKKYGTRKHTRDKFRERWILNVNKNMLASFAKNAASSLEDLEFSPTDIRKWIAPNTTRILPRSVRTELDGREITFGLVPLLPNGLKTRFLKQLNGIVWKNPANQLRLLF